MVVSIEEALPDQDEVRLLFAAADQRSAGLYPGESRPGLSAAQLAAAGVVFFVAREDGVALGCGGFVQDGDAAELKRIFVRETARGRGVGAALLRALEAASLARGSRVMRLETGVKSVEALRLYRRFGYGERGPFGAYALDPNSVFMEKRLR